MVAIRERITSSQRIVADYDSAMDVLYVSLDPPRPGEGEDAADGIVLRYATTDDAPCGVTVIGYRANKWQEAMSRLAEIVGAHPSIEARDAARLIEDAVTSG